MMTSRVTNLCYRYMSLDMFTQVLLLIILSMLLRNCAVKGTENVAPKLLVNLTQDGYFYDDVLSFVVKDNSTCYSCIDCSVTGYPVPNVTWLYHDNSDPYRTVITNKSDSTSDLFLLDNAQKLCFSSIGSYLAHHFEFKCTAANVVGNTSAIFGFDRDSTLDFLRPGDFASKLQTYLVSEGDNITLIMDTDANNYSEEVAFRVCRHDLSLLVNKSDSCCDCFSLKMCEWGILKSSSSPQHICLFMTSQPGLYQFEIYTSHFPCYQKLGSPIKISKNSEEKHKTFPRFLVYVISGCVISIISILLTIITYQVYKRVWTRRKFTRGRKFKLVYQNLSYINADDDDRDGDNNDDVKKLLMGDNSESEGSVITEMNGESCTLKNCQVISKTFGYDGGELLIEEHAVKVTVPIGAIEKGYEVQIEAAASLFGPFTVPEGYHSISAYVWIGACYEFNKNLKVELEHDIDLSEETDVSGVCVLTACEEDKGIGENNRVLYKMHEDACEYQLNKTTCTFFTSHFCSKCLAVKEENIKSPKRVIMYHYLPENYKSEYEFAAEVTFCYDLQFCKERLEERYVKRRMELESSTFIRISNWKDDKICLVYSKKFQNWKICHSNDDEITVDALKFRLWYETVEDLLKDEENDRFPPRFKLKVMNKDYSLSTLNLIYEYKICIKSKKRKDKHLTLNISGFGHCLPNKAAISHHQPIIYQSTPTSSQQQSGQGCITTTLDSQLQLQQGLQQLQADQPASQAMNVTYNVIAGGDINTISLERLEDSAVKPKFNSLQAFSNDIANTVDVNEILPMMMQQHLVTSDQLQDLINPLHTTAVKQQKLSNIILGLPEDCVNQFLHCLLKTNYYEPHKQLYDKLYTQLNIAAT